MRDMVTNLCPDPLSWHCRPTVGQNTQSLWKQTDVDFTIGLYNILCLIRIAHARSLSDGTHYPMVTTKSVRRMTVHDGESGALFSKKKKKYIYVADLGHATCDT